MTPAEAGQVADVGVDRPATDGPATDAEVPAFWQALGLPGLIDVHVHFMPERVLAKVWAFFDAIGPDAGGPWPITYRLPEAERIDRLRALGVRAFPSMVYPHKPDMAEWLNAWAADFARRTPDCVHTATFYPEPSVDRYVAAALDAGARIFKVHLEVGGYDPRHELLAPVWRRLARTGTPVVVHCGSGPRAGAYTGPGPMAAVLAACPELTLVVAHMGLPEYAQFLALARRYPRVHLDTTMAFTDFTERFAPFPPALVAELADVADRVVLGSDFPNIPHPYAHQLAVLARLGLGADWMRQVLYANGARLLGLAP